MSNDHLAPQTLLFWTVFFEDFIVCWTRGGGGSDAGDGGIRLLSIRCFIPPPRGRQLPLRIAPPAPPPWALCMGPGSAIGVGTGLLRADSRAFPTRGCISPCRRRQWSGRHRSHDAETVSSGTSIPLWPTKQRCASPTSDRRKRKQGAQKTWHGTPVVLPGNDEDFMDPPCVRGCTVRCARAVRKVGYFGPIFPDGAGDRSNYCVPTCTGLLRFVLSAKSQIMNQDKPCFTPKMPDCCPNLLLLSGRRSSPGGGWFAGWSRER